MGNVVCLSESERIYKYEHHDGDKSSDRFTYTFQLNEVKDTNESVVKITESVVKITEPDDKEQHGVSTDYPSFIDYDLRNLQRRSTIHAALSAAQKTLREPIGEQTPSKSVSNSNAMDGERSKCPVLITRRTSIPQLRTNDTITIQRTKVKDNYVISRRSIKQIYPVLQLQPLMKELSRDDTITFTIRSIDSDSIWHHYDPLGSI
eukprot:822861_1